MIRNNMATDSSDFNGGLFRQTKGEADWMSPKRPFAAFRMQDTVPRKTATKR